jgi:hypothetical protein
MTTPETRTGKNATSREGRGGMRTSEISWEVDGRAYEATTTEGRESQRPLILCKDSKKEQRNKSAGSQTADAAWAETLKHTV